MKALKTLFLTLVLAFTLCACNSSSESIDILAVYPLVDGYDVVYADQTADTVSIYTTKKWTVSTTQPWFSVPSEYTNPTIQPSGVYYDNVPVIFEENTTDSIRKGMLIVSADGKSVYHPFMQVTWLNVTYPTPDIVKVDGTIKSATFSEVVNYNDSIVKVAFTCYSPASVSCPANWIGVDSTKVYDKGSYILSFPCAANPSMTTRATYITVKNNSLGLKTAIKVSQTGAIE